MSAMIQNSQSMNTATENWIHWISSSHQQQVIIIYQPQCASLANPTFPREPAPRMKPAIESSNYRTAVVQLQLPIRKAEEPQRRNHRPIHAVKEKRRDNARRASQQTAGKTTMRPARGVGERRQWFLWAGGQKTHPTVTTVLTITIRIRKKKRKKERDSYIEKEC